MTESVSTPRSRSRSNRSSVRSRQRSAAAAGSTSARATSRPGSAPAGDASRDELTLDLFGDPVLEPGERVPVTARDEAAAEAEAAAGVADDAAAGRQASLDGFSAPEAASAAGHAEADGAVKPEVAVATGGVSAPEGGDAANADGVSAADGVAMKVVDVPAADGVAAKAADVHAADGVATKAADLSVADGATVTATGLQAADVAAAKTADRQATDGDGAKAAVEAAAGVAAVKSREGRSSGDAVKERRSSSGGKRRAAAGASDATSVQSAPVATSVDKAPNATGSNPAPDAASTVEPQTPAQPAEPANTANTRDAAPTHASPSPVTQPVASAASFVTKPSSERTQPAAPAFDPDTHLRPLTDRLAALQADMDGLTRAADREMRRVNRLLLALAVVVLAGLVALMLQTRQIAHLKQDAAAKQQRIDRLAADLSTQQATLMTLEEHHEALLSQVDRLQRNANRDAAVAKRARRTR
ncbi:flagellar hook-length control protein FliK [Burkholderia cepacia]|uniref:Flagellar hook-length control protein FliK n=1 Tax=Burkholderia cepacia TaxID=292 RepID=A0A2S8IX12_BURCE|nr:flagellar hook-length control protein FliK [Burkholderia cepacia]PQP19344.1 flagellar hook-length control protein FliK [Burkholderia cepacia]HDR9507052.1 flagellar hook-length control protein FliK [Burkholderia cepacia]